MTLLVPWLVFPAVLAVVSLGWGIVLQSAAGGSLGGVLLLPAGFAAVIVGCDLATLSATTSRLTVPFVLVVAAAGLAFGVRRPRRPPRPNGWILVACLLVFAVYAAPVVLSGEATFAGYAILDDSANWFSLIDWVFEHGRSVAGLVPPAIFARIVRDYLTTGYPLGSMMPLGVDARVVGENVAWVFQPYLAFQAGMLALALWGLLEGLVRSPRVRTLVVFVAAQPALLYGYSLLGSIKELVMAPLLALVAAFVASALRSPRSVRALVPLVVSIAAVLAVLNVAAIVWLVPALVPLCMLASRLSVEELVERSAFVVCLVAVLALPTVVTARAFETTANTILTSGASASNALAMLVHRLSYLQILGIWPVGDFRGRPATMWPTELLLLLLVALAVCGVRLAFRRHVSAVLVYLLICIGGSCFTIAVGTPWTIGKAFATASPAVLLVGLAAIEGGMPRRLPRLLGPAAGVAVAAGVLWSNALAYGSVRLAPRTQLLEEAEIGQRFSGDGPSLILGPEWYYAMHFMRGLDATWLGPSADIDSIPLSTIAQFRTLVLTRGPLESRPPSNYRLVWSGPYDNVWQQIPSAPPVLTQLSLTSDSQPLAVPACSSVKALAARAAGVGGRVAYVARVPALRLDLARLQHPSNWPAGDGGLYPTSSGQVTATVAVAASRRYELWLGGFTPGRLTVSVDGVRVATVEHLIERSGQFFPLGSLELSRGSHRIVLDYSRSLLQPGSSSRVPFDPMGPLLLGTQTDELPVHYLAPSEAVSLCGRSLNWIEAVAPTSAR